MKQELRGVDPPRIRYRRRIERRSYSVLAPRAKAMTLAVVSCFAGYSYGNPVAPQVVSGSASFKVAGKTLSITNSAGAVINWQGFSIAPDEVTRFLQSGAASSVLNRVTGGEASNILGRLLSNGRVFLINPNGVFIGGGAVVDVAGFVSSSLNLSDADFLAGKFRFTDQIGAGRIVNQGTIQTPAGGQVYLVAPNVENHGVITSPTGEVILAAGKSVELVQPASPYVRVELTAPDNAAVNVGQIVAQAGRVGIYGTSIRNSGLVSANSASVDAQGRIVFRAKKDITLESTSRLEANGPKGGDITVQAEAGTLIADGVVVAKGTSEHGGTIRMLGERVGLIGHSNVDASGDAGGGTVLVGGDLHGQNPDVQSAVKAYVGNDVVVRADAIKNGDGGKVVIWSDDTTQYYGHLSIRGGSVAGNGGVAEVSGKETLIFRGTADGRAQPGFRGGKILLDPRDIIIANAGSESTQSNSAAGTPDQLFDNPDEATSVTFNPQASGAFDGFDEVNLQASRDIKVLDPFNVKTAIGVTGTNASLILSAGRDITISADVTSGKVNANEGHISLLAGDNVKLGANVATDNAGNITIRADASNAQLGFTSATNVAADGVGAITRTGGVVQVGSGVITLSAVGVGVSGTPVHVLHGVGGSVTASSTGTGAGGGIYLTSAGALNLGALSAGGNIEISTTGSNALTVSGTIATGNQTATATPSGSVTLTSGAGIAVNNTIVTGSSLVADTGGNDTGSSGTITLDAVGGITGNATGSLTTGAASASGATGNDTATSGSIVLKGTSVGLANATVALTTGGATISAADTTSDTATAGSITMGTTGATMALINNGTGTNKLIVRQGTASDTTVLGATTASQLVATTAGATGNAGGIFVTSDRGLNLGALSAGGNIEISTTGSNALTVSGTIATASNGNVGLKTANGLLTISANVSANGSGWVALQAGGSSSDIVLNSSTVSSTSGDLQAIAGRSITTSTATGATNEFASGGSLLLDAGDAIGTANNRIDTSVGTVAAVSQGATTAGDIYLNQRSGPLSVGTATGLAGRSNLSGIATQANDNDIYLTTQAGSLTVLQNITATGLGNVAVKAIGSASDIKINGGSVSSTGGGRLQAIAGRDITTTTATGTTAEFSTNGQVLLSAGNGVGTDINRIDLSTPIAAANVTGGSATGGVYLNQLSSGGNLAIGTANGLDGNGNVSGISTAGSGGSVVVSAGGSNAVTVSQTISTSGTGNVTFSHVGALNINADISASGSVSESGGGSVSIGGSGTRTLSATNGSITFNDAVTTLRPLVVNAGTGGSNGLISLKSGLASSGLDVELNGRDWGFTSSPIGSIDVGAGVIQISHATNGIINLGSSGGGTGSILDSANLARLKSSGMLKIGDSAFGDTVNVAGSVDLAATTPKVLIQAASVTQGSGRIGTPNPSTHLLTFSTTNGSTASVAGTGGTANLSAKNTASGSIGLDVLSGNANLSGTTGAAADNTAGGVDVSVENGTLTIASGGGGVQATGSVALRSSGDLAVNAPVQASSGSVTLVAGRASGMGSAGIGEGAWGSGGGYQVSRVTIGAPVRSGYSNLNGRINIFASGPVLQDNTLDAGLQAFHSDPLTQGKLQVVTFNDGSQAAKITLENDKTTTSNPGVVGNCGSPSVAGTGNCAGPLTLETRFADGRVTEFSASDIKYKSINGTTIFGVGTAADVQFIAPSQTITSGNINGKNVFFYATAGNIDLGVQIKNSDINVGNRGGSLNLLANGSININSPVDGAKAGVSVGQRNAVLSNGNVIAEYFDHDLKLSATRDINISGAIYMKGDLTLRADASVAEVSPLSANSLAAFGSGSGSVKVATAPLSNYTSNTPVAVFPLEIKAQNIVIGSTNGGIFPVKNFTLDSSAPLPVGIGIEQRADAVIQASAKLSVYLSGDLSMKSGNVEATTSGQTLRNTAVTALVGSDVLIKGVTNGAANRTNINMSAGSASTDTIRGGGAISSADSFMIATNSKEIDVGGSVTLAGGSTPLNGQSTAVAKIDPNTLKIKAGGDLVLIGGAGLGGAATIVNDGNIELIIGGSGAMKSFSYKVNGVSRSVSLPGGLVLLGGPGTGLFGANNLQIGLGDQIQASFPGGGGLSVYSTSGLAAATITANSPRAFDNLLNYIIFAANEETRAGRLRLGLGAGDDSNLPTCN